MKQLNEKVAIVTGAGQGIGKGIALCLAKRGVKVIATGRRPEPIEQTIAEIKKLGREGFAMTCDSADRARVEEVVKAAAEKYGTELNDSVLQSLGSIAFEDDMSGTYIVKVEQD